MILACTHYVALTKLIGELYPNIHCHDPIPYLVEKKLLEWDKFNRGEDLFITTGDPNESNFAAKKAFDVDSSFESIELTLS